MTHVKCSAYSKKVMVNNLPFLGEDIMLIIFTKCDPRTVGRVRCTSNTWRWRLRGKLFAKENWIANEHQNGSALLGLRYSDFGERSHWSKQVNAGDGSINIVRLPLQLRDVGYYTILRSDYGNILVKYPLAAEEMALLVVNPMTRSAVLSFKDTRFDNNKLKWMLWHSSEKEWKTSGVYQTQIEKVGPKSVVVDGVLFWIGWGGFFNLEPTHLLGFSLEDETFFEEPIPVENTKRFNSITKINKQLGFVSYQDIAERRKVEVWGRTTPTSSNDDLRTEVVMSNIHLNGGNRRIIYHEGWQMGIFVQTVNYHWDGLFELNEEG
ncbi:hypothetical protein PIB30_033733 [Stylosanthes scabra]|uniref:F-box domain-containing protein n=1 Tax=Stylosanthes scabra TaxID=79078 RepID=A0ABU6ZA71_9FABA|nr:hypothetical protein [Stylosanthes scabra]